MNYLLKKSAFSAEQNTHPHSVFTKHYQHIEMHRLLTPYVETALSVVEIGPHQNFTQLIRFPGGKRAVIDPYNGAEGAGLSDIPQNFPEETDLYRCLLGEDSHPIPYKKFDLSFSISVSSTLARRKPNTLAGRLTHHRKPKRRCAMRFAESYTGLQGRAA